MLLKRSATAGACRQSVPAQLVQCHVPLARRVQNPSRPEILSPCKVAEAASAQTKDAKPALSMLERVSTLSEALPYLQRFRGKTIVIKYGGAAMKDPTLKAGVITDIVLLSCVGIRIVLVHGGGPEINAWLDKVGIQPQFIDGKRVTDAPTMEIAEMVLGGKVNKSLVALIQQAGGQALGLSGKDGGLLTAKVAQGGKWGLVGEITKVNPAVLQMAVEKGYIPVVATIANDQTNSGGMLNINADDAAGEIAAALKAEKLVLMTDVPGVLRDKNDVGTKIQHMTLRDCTQLKEDKIIVGGMIPKVDCCYSCVSQGVRAAHIIDGRAPHSILMELLTDEGIGTMITG